MFSSTSSSPTQQPQTDRPIKPNDWVRKHFRGVAGDLRLNTSFRFWILVALARECEIDCRHWRLWQPRCLRKNPLDRKLCVLAFRRVCPSSSIRCCVSHESESSSQVAFCGQGKGGHAGWLYTYGIAAIALCHLAAGLRGVRRAACGRGACLRPHVSGLQTSDRHPRPSFLAGAGRFAGHDAGGELRHDMHLSGIG